MTRFLAGWWQEEKATALAEFSLVFPILTILLLGIYDIGSALNVNQKAIAASQIVADLIARHPVVDDDMIDEAIRAGELAIMPYNRDRMGIDIASLSYGSNNQPQVVWRETRNMAEDDNILQEAVPLGRNGDGVLAVTVTYLFRPAFGDRFVDHINMRETSFARGRRTAVVDRE